MMTLYLFLFHFTARPVLYCTVHPNRIFFLLSLRSRLPFLFPFFSVCFYLLLTSTYILTFLFSCLKLSKTCRFFIKYDFRFDQLWACNSVISIFTVSIRTRIAIFFCCFRQFNPSINYFWQFSLSNWRICNDCRTFFVFYFSSVYKKIYLKNVQFFYFGSFDDENVPCHQFFYFLLSHQ